MTLLLISNIFQTISGLSTVDFEQVLCSVTTIGSSVISHRKHMSDSRINYMIYAEFPGTWLLIKQNYWLML